MPAQTSHENEALQKARIDYAERCFQNVQDLNRMMDQKANFLLAAVALITGALGVLATAALNRKTPDDWQLYLKIASFSLLLLYLLLAFRVILITTQIFRARATMVNADPVAPGLLFPIMIMKRYPNDLAYKTKTASLSYDDILEDYSHQIIEVSNIYTYKQRDIGTATDTFQLLSWLWIVAMCLLALTAFLLPS